MKKKRIVLFAIALAAVAAGGAIARHRLRGAAQGGVVISGNIETTEAQLSFKIPGRLAQRLVDEGEEVKRGQIVARLDETDQLIAEARAEAALAAAQAALAELEAGSRPEEIRLAQAQVSQAQFTLDEIQRGSRAQEIADAQAELERALAAEKTALAELELARADEKRFRELLSQNAIGDREYQVYRTRLDAAINASAEAQARASGARERLSLRQEGSRAETIQRARAALEQAQAQYDLVKAGPRRETIEQARAQLQLSSETLRLARQQRMDTVLHAPFDGVAMSKSAEPGEYLNPGSPVIALADLDRVWLRAYIGARDLDAISLGAEVAVTADAYPDKTFRGRVAFISSQAEFTPKTVQTFEERVKLMYRVKIDLDNRSRELKPGMPADAHLGRHE